MKHVATPYILGFVVLVLGVLVIVLVLALIFSTSADKKLFFSSKRLFNGRAYTLVVPKHITPDTKIILGLDGLGGSGKRFAYYTSLHNVDPNAILIYPDPQNPNQKGVRPGWNADFCCGSGWVQKVDDVAFLRELTLYIARQHGVPDAKKFAVGFSNGAFMVQRLAIESPGLFTAVAEVAGSIGTVDTSLRPQNPIPILLVHGKKDRTVPYGGGSGFSDKSFKWLSFEQTKSVWEDANRDSAEVRVEVFPDNGHEWADWRIYNIWHTTPSLSRQVVGFFDEQS